MKRAYIKLQNANGKEESLVKRGDPDNVEKLGIRLIPHFSIITVQPEKDGIKL
jgi:hypothetical protein